MRFNYELPPLSSDLAEQASEGRLGARVKMHFRLLQQKYGRSVAAQQFGDDWQCLADAVTDIDQIALRSLGFTSEFSDLNLKRFTFILP